MQIEQTQTAAKFAMGQKQKGEVQSFHSAWYDIVLGSYLYGPCGFV